MTPYPPGLLVPGGGQLGRILAAALASPAYEAPAAVRITGEG